MGSSWQTLLSKVIEIDITSNVVFLGYDKNSTSPLCVLPQTHKPSLILRGKTKQVEELFTKYLASTPQSHQGY